jgi:hypothetical protein
VRNTSIYWATSNLCEGSAGHKVVAVLGDSLLLGDEREMSTLQVPPQIFLAWCHLLPLVARVGTTDPKTCGGPRVSEPDHASKIQHRPHRTTRIELYCHGTTPPSGDGGLWLSVFSCRRRQGIPEISTTNVHQTVEHRPALRHSQLPGSFSKRARPDLLHLVGRRHTHEKKELQTTQRGR